MSLLKYILINERWKPVELSDDRFAFRQDYDNEITPSNLKWCTLQATHFALTSEYIYKYMPGGDK